MFSAQDDSLEMQDSDSKVHSATGSTSSALKSPPSLPDANRNATSLHSQASLNSHYDLDTDSDEAGASWIGGGHNRVGAVQIMDHSLAMTANHVKHNLYRQTVKRMQGISN